MKKHRLSAVSVLHYIRLVYRSILFLWLLIDYISFRIHGEEEITDRLGRMPTVLVIIWIVFAVEMLARFFPFRYESPGCQKQFSQKYIKSGETQIIAHDNNSVMLIALIWIAFNGVLGAMCMYGILDQGIMILLSSAYSVCDVICILFFCPFQTWFMKNKCCTVCRIYNWDYAMMFTPLFFVGIPAAWSLLALSLILLARWEIAYFKYPERFSENTNDYLKCRNCTEKLCHHKRQLQSLWKQIEAYSLRRINQLKK